MEVLKVSLALNPKLHAELREACERSKCTAAQFVGECVEVTLAERRDRASAPRQRANARAVPVQVVEECGPALSPSDIPTVADLEAIT